MISVDEARARIVQPLRPTGAEMVGLADAWGRVTAAPVLARLNQPPADVSAMDGYALRAEDMGARQVIGAAPAGHPFAGAVGPGQAVRLFTGSIVPDGADAILIQEDAGRVGDQVTPTETPRAGAHIRRKGQDFAEGDALIAAGVRLGARGVGLAAAANHPWIAVHRRPVVAILATGDEIALPGEPIPPGGIVSFQRPRAGGAGAGLRRHALGASGGDRHAGGDRGGGGLRAGRGPAGDDGGGPAWASMT